MLGRPFAVLAIQNTFDAMSDNSISIVPQVSAYPDRQLKAQEIVDWLITERIVEPSASRCLLSSDLGYSIAKGAKSTAIYPDSLPFGLAVNGLEIVTERQVFDAGSNGIDKIICPKCAQNIVSDNWDLDSWSNNETDELTCTKCGLRSDIHQFHFEPARGFSNLGFRFWNWPGLTPAFIKEFEQKLGCRVRVVHQHI